MNGHHQAAYSYWQDMQVLLAPIGCAYESMIEWPFPIAKMYRMCVLVMVDTLHVVNASSQHYATTPHSIQEIGRQLIIVD